MTREEREFAKSRIEYLLKVDNCLDKHDREALEIAIQALSQEPTEICCATCKHERLDDRNYKCEFQNECLVEGKRGKYEFAYAKYEPIVEQEPCTDAVTQKSGKWIITTFSVTGRHYQCSECKYIHTFTNFEYCPKCGARMVEPQGSEDKE